MHVEKIVELKGHRAGVYALCEGAQPHIVLSGGSDKYLVKWDVTNIQEAEAVAQLPGIIYSICAIPHTTHLLVGEAHGGVHVIDAEKKQRVANALLHTGPVFDMKILPGEKHFASVSGDGTLVIADINSLQTVKKFYLCSEKVRSIAMNPNGKEIAVACGDGTIRIIDLADLAETNKINAHSLSVYSLLYHPYQSVLLSGGRDAHLKVWDVYNNYQLLQSIPAHNYAIYSMAFNADSRLLATASRDKTIKIWDAETLSVKVRINKDVHSGHANSVNALIWDHRSNHIITTGDDRTLMVWKVSEN